MDCRDVDANIVRFRRYVGPYVGIDAERMGDPQPNRARISRCRPSSVFQPAAQASMLFARSPHCSYWFLISVTRAVMAALALP